MFKLSRAASLNHLNAKQLRVKIKVAVFALKGT
jgi:hypothetical protein